VTGCCTRKPPDITYEPCSASGPSRRAAAPAVTSQGQRPSPPIFALPCPGPSPEHDISILTGLQATRSLTQTVREVTALYWSKTGEFFSVDPRLEAIAFAEGVPRGATPLVFAAGPEGGFLRKHKAFPIDVVVNCCHGGPGEDGTIQAAFDLAGMACGPSLVGAYLHGQARFHRRRRAGLSTLPR
jgi:D-alanine-D-alanine ligase